MSSVSRGSSGVSLSEGKKLLNADYDLEVDTRPEELTNEFLDQYNWTLDEVDDNWYQVVDDARKFARDEVKHVAAIARHTGADPSKLDEERIEAQVEGGILKMSNVWDGEWRNTIAGTCQERAITLHAIYKELGLDSEYHEGYLELQGGGFGGHGWTTVGEYISDPSNAGDGVTPIEEADRYDERKIWLG